METKNFIQKKWSFYLDGWFHHDRMEFLPDGKIDSNGTEGFHRWVSNDGLLDIYDETNKLCYSLKFIPSANLLVNTAEHYPRNNNIFLAYNYSHTELARLFPNDDLSWRIANKSALYKSPSGEIWGKLFFGIDGKIYNYHNPNEKYWAVEAGRLKIYTENRELILSEDAVSYTGDFSQSVKQITLNYLPGGGHHYLDFLKIHDETGSDHATEFLNIDACFSNRSDTLLVIFNSAGGEYSGQDVYHEFYHIPYRFAVDYIRISQSKPTRVYLDCCNQIETLVNLNRHKKVVFIGMSIGGFSSIWFAETMARKNPSVQYYSLAIQPLGGLNQPFAEKMKTAFSYGYRSKTLTCDITDEYEAEGLCLDLEQYFKENIGNARHYVIYDALNKAEKEHSAKLLSDRTFVTETGYGIGHSEGCVKIYDSGFLDPLLRNLLITPHKQPAFSDMAHAA
ncbi:hypothetical protein [Neisseria dentiae]|uniref:hypothetical protein n=1 Tax=Neisseria dentiae TaxID=194197 RepID=UPI0035A1608D